MDNVDKSTIYCRKSLQYSSNVKAGACVTGKGCVTIRGPGWLGTSSLCKSRAKHTFSDQEPLKCAYQHRTPNGVLARVSYIPQASPIGLLLLCKKGPKAEPSQRLSETRCKSSTSPMNKQLTRWYKLPRSSMDVWLKSNQYVSCTNLAHLKVSICHQLPVSSLSRQ